MISFIIPAHNEENLIADTIAAIHKAAGAAGQSYEIVVVNDQSTDRTRDVALAAGAQVIDVNHRHIAATRNAGAKVARGQHLFFVDADTLIHERLLGQALHALWNGAAGGGGQLAVMGASSRMQNLGLAGINRILLWSKIAPGCFVFCTKQAFEQTGGFDETLFAGEDVAMSRALAATGRFVIVREKAHTSARKMHSHGWTGHLKLMGHYMMRGNKVLRDRKHLGIWYDAR